jgi:hypothetical protein
MKTLRTAQLPKPHEILRRVFNTPEKVKALALELGLSTNHVHKLLRGAASSDLDRLCAAIFLASTFGDDGVRGAGLIADYVHEYRLTIIEQSATPYDGEHDRVLDSSSLLREATEAVDALMTGKPSSETLKELVELRDKADEVISRLSITTTGVER